MLADHPGVYARLRREVLDTLGPNGKVGPDNLRDMKYLRAVLDGEQVSCAFVHSTARLTCGIRNAALVSERVSSLNLPHGDVLVLNRAQTLEPQMPEAGSSVALYRWRKADLHPSLYQNSLFTVADASEGGSVGTYR